MFFEGVTTPDKFLEVVRKALTTPDPSMITPEPFWTMVSSNIGSALTDDGYVFHSKGRSGSENIFIGVKNAWTDSLNWHLGHRFFIAENYVPGAQGVNGTFTNDGIFEGHRLHHDNTWGGVTPTTLPLKYWISVNKDRVIIATSNQFAYEPVANRTVLYLGLMDRYSKESDSSAVCLGSTYGWHFNGRGFLRVLRDRRGYFNSQYYTWSSEHLPSQGTTWGKRFFASDIPLHHASEGVRGQLEGMLTAFYFTDVRGATVPREGEVTVNGKTYICLEVDHYKYTRYSNLGPNTANHHCYLIEKV